jgi:7-cyano-7-deazaguanine reductase
MSAKQRLNRHSTLPHLGVDRRWKFSAPESDRPANKATEKSNRPCGGNPQTPGMPDREDLKNLSLLGKPDTRLPASPDEAHLETFLNQRPGRRYWITLNCPEFSSLCPVTGQPDSARLVIRYVPGERCVETKSLKFYLASFRNQPAFNEEIVNRILDDLVAALQPVEMVVRGDFAPRGGIQLTTEATFPDLSPQPA